MKKIVCGILAGCLVLATATGCQKNASGKTPITLNEVAHSIFYAPQYAAIELGYFDEEGLDVTLVNGGGADKVMDGSGIRRSRHRLPWALRPPSIPMPTEKPTTP